MPSYRRQTVGSSATGASRSLSFGACLIDSLSVPHSASASPQAAKTATVARGEVESKDAGVLQVADEQRVAAVERQPQDEAFSRGDLLDHRGVGGDPQANLHAYEVVKSMRDRARSATGAKRSKDSEIEQLMFLREKVSEAAPKIAISCAPA